MTISRRFDAGLAATIAGAVILIVVVKGDALYLGLWYYVAVPTVLLVLSAVLRTKPLFSAGASFALATTFLCYMTVNWLIPRPEGLLGLGHLFSLPGAAVGALVGALAVRHYAGASPVVSFLVGFFAVGTGFLTNQLLLCHTVMHCGMLSLSPRLLCYAIQLCGD